MDRFPHAAERDREVERLKAQGWPIPFIPQPSEFYEECYSRKQLLAAEAPGSMTVVRVRRAWWHLKKQSVAIDPRLLPGSRA